LSTPEQRFDPDPNLMDRLRLLFAASRGFWLVNQINFGDGIAYFGMLALMTLFMERDIGLSTNGATSAISFFSGMVTLTMAIGGGWVSDRLGVRRALTLAVSVILVGRIFLVSSPLAGTESLIHSMAWSSLLIMAIGEGVLQPALYSGVKEYTDERTATLGYAFLYSVMNMGIVAGELISPNARAWWAGRGGIATTEDPSAGISGAFWFFIGVTVVMLLVHLNFFTRRVEERDRIDTVDTVEEPAASWGERIRSMPILDRRFLFFIFVLLPVRTLFAHQFLTMPHYVTRAFPPEVGARWEWINALNPLVIVIGVPLFAMFTARTRVVNMMIIGTAVSAVSTLLLVSTPNVNLLLTYVVMFSLGEAMWSSRFLEYIANIAPAGRVGIYMGIANIPWFLAKMTTGLYAGHMLDRFVPAQGLQDPQGMWWIYFGIALISPIGLIIGRKWLLRSVHEDSIRRV
jgi:POT family proton-dependent oligopeptide transporter